MDFLDVGQGDGIFVRMEDGTTILVDSGSTDNSRLYEYTLEPFLLSRGVDELDYVIVTHCDNDHISALKALLNESVIHVTNFACHRQHALMTPTKICGNLRQNRHQILWKYMPVCVYKPLTVR